MPLKGVCLLRRTSRLLSHNNLWLPFRLSIREQHKQKDLHFHVQQRKPKPSLVQTRLIVIRLRVFLSLDSAACGPAEIRFHRLPCIAVPLEGI